MIKCEERAIKHHTFHYHDEARAKETKNYTQLMMGKGEGMKAKQGSTYQPNFILDLDIEVFFLQVPNGSGLFVG